jgi:hypothetical protein
MRSSAWGVFAVLSGLLGACPPASGFPCVFPSPSLTLRQDAVQAKVIVYCILENPRPVGETGKTDLRVDAVLKTDGSVKVGQVIAIPRYDPPDPKVLPHFLIFCDVANGQLDPYRGVPFKGKAGADYLKGVLALDPKDRTATLRYYFRFLEHSEKELANDAYQEFVNASYADYREVARTLPADKIVRWLKDPNTPDSRYGLYGSMLGYCGKPEHAELLRRLLDNPKDDFHRGADGMLAGYVMLEPKDGFEYLAGILKESSKDFLLRYGALKAVRFFWDSRPDLVEKKDLLRAVSALLDQADIADLLIEDLRKWEQWQVSERVLALANKASHNVPIIRRAILRYALACPGPEAAAYIEEQRKKDPRLVQDAVELLKLESTATPATQAPKN